VEKPQDLLKPKFVNYRSHPHILLTKESHVSSPNSRSGEVQFNFDGQLVIYNLSQMNSLNVLIITD
jgi:hypothetical protein